MRVVVRAAGAVVGISGIMSLSAAASGPDSYQVVSAPGDAAGGAPKVGHSLARRGEILTDAFALPSEPASVTVIAEPVLAEPVPSPVEVYGAATFGPLASLGIPGLVLEAYQNAAALTAVDDPTCGIRWQVLAGIGKIESRHANGGQVTAEGDTQPKIIGPVLSGNGVASIGDSDNGLWDGDTTWDHAVGPMQFIPGTWRGYGADGSGDGKADPHNVFDSTIAAARYLCAGGGDLATVDGLAAALLRYNNSAAYVARVMSWIAAYDAGRGHVVHTPGPGQETPPPVSTPALIDAPRHRAPTVSPSPTEPTVSSSPTEPSASPSELPSPSAPGQPSEPSAPATQPTGEPSAPASESGNPTHPGA